MKYRFGVVFWMELAVVLTASQAKTLSQDAEASVLQRVAELEERVAAQARVKEELQQVVKKEVDRRLVLETLLLRTMEEQAIKLGQVESSSTGGHDRIDALESTLRDEISLREEAELSGDLRLQDLESKVSLMEGNLNLITFMDSRLRDLEELVSVHGQEISELQGVLPSTRRAVEQLRRELRRQRTSVEQVENTGENALRGMEAIQNRVRELDSWVLSYNVTSAEDRQLLQEVEDTTSRLTVFLQEAQTTISNLTLAVNSLKNQMSAAPLKLCPQDYRKVGRDCLHLLEEKLTWEEARRSCEELAITVGGAGDLAQPSHIDEFKHYVAKLHTATQYLWVGGIRESSVWRWASGSDIDHEELPWDLGEPDDSDDQYHLCIKSSATKFHDCKDSARLKAVCQIR
ncbi:paramyosin-like [Penaeus monodon]|uniref:paramyosin-like n=1 Tax=Penaeus monodon TaxID=6687 RepID=UPI0018A6F211|nr:paramyosin-like [Penaeus monodon]